MIDSPDLLEAIHSAERKVSDDLEHRSARKLSDVSVYERDVLHEAMFNLLIKRVLTSSCGFVLDCISS